MKDNLKYMSSKQNIEDLLDRYINGKSSESESAMAEQWLHDNIAEPEHDELFKQLLAKAPVENDSESIERGRRFIEELFSADKRAKRKPMRRLALRIAEVAAVAAILIFSLTVHFRPTSQVEWNEVYATWGETRHVDLPDGSQIWLNSGSRIFYPSRFDGDTRTVYVDGEIFADIVTDPCHPFIVSSTGAKVKVLGTKFSMKSYAENPKLEVALMQGSVALQASDSYKTLDHTLQVGDMVRYNRTNGEMETYSIDVETYGSWYTSGNLCFINQSLSDIAADLERRFNVNIIIESQELAEELYYASFVNNENLEQILRALNGSHTMNISWINNTVIISPI